MAEELRERVDANSAQEAAATERISQEMVEVNERLKKFGKVLAAKANCPAEFAFFMAGLVERIRDLVAEVSEAAYGALSLAEIDKAIVELWPQFDHKQCVSPLYFQAICAVGI